MNRAVVLVGGFALLGALATCGGDEASPLQPADVVGDWAGTTEQDQPLSLKVTSAGVTHGTFRYVINGRCAFSADVTITGGSAPMPIIGGRFSTGKTQIGSKTFLTAHGEFTSATKAAGSLLVEDEQCGDTVAVNWAAAKQ